MEQIAQKKKKGTVVKSPGWENKLTWKTLKGQRRPGAWRARSLIISASIIPKRILHPHALNSAPKCTECAHTLYSTQKIVHRAITGLVRSQKTSIHSPSFLPSLPPAFAFTLSTGFRSREEQTGGGRSLIRLFTETWSTTSEERK